MNTPDATAGSQQQLVRRIVVQGLTNDVREALMGARKWLMRIHQRKSEFPPEFLDGCDPKPLADKIGELLAEPISRRYENGQSPNTPAQPRREEGQQ